MIHSLLQVMCLSLVTGVGALAPSPVSIKEDETHTQQTDRLERVTNNSNEQTYELYANIGTNYTNFYNVTPTSVLGGIPSSRFEELQMNVASFKTNKNIYNEMLGVDLTIYDQNLTCHDSYYNDATVVLVPDNTVYQETSSLVAMSITPYGLNIDTEVTLRFNMSWAIDNWEPSDTGYMYFRTYTATSIDNNFNQYLDVANYYTYRKNAQMYYDLTTSENGYAYQEYIQDVSIYMDTTYPNRQVTITQEISIVPNKTNYVYMNVVPYWTGTLLAGDYPYAKVDMRTWNRSQNMFKVDRNIKFTGTYIPPVTNYEVVDIPSMMWEILSMPFAFISTAFNLTLFAGTPYQFNVSNFILMIFGVLVFIFIFKLLLKK